MTGKRSDKPIIAIAVVLIAVILVGEVVVYTSDYTDYGADARMEDGDIVYEVSADGSKVYSVVVSDNGSRQDMQRLYVYYDPAYASNYEDVDVSIGAQPLDQEYYLQQVMSQLESRGIDFAEYVDAEQLAEALASDMESGACSGSGLVVISGALPDTVYTGNEGDAILRWLDAGGNLYWLGNLLGACYATTDGLVGVEGDYQSLFFGARCLNEGDTGTAYSEVESNGYTHALSLQSNNVRYGVDASRLPGDRASLSIGFTEDGYSSITFVQKGAGSVCVIGGDYSNYQRNDLVMVLASGLGPESTLVEVREGSVSNGTATGRIEGAEGENLSAFIYLGGYYPVFSDLFWL